MENRLQTLIEQAISESSLQPNIHLFNKISQLIKNSDELKKNTIVLLKAHLNQQNNYKSQLQLLELIEYLTCEGDRVIHEGFNSKTFLKSINMIFGRNNLHISVKEKTLNLIMFWYEFFKHNKQFGNFEWYYKTVKEKGIPFPEYKASPYDQRTTKQNDITINDDLMTSRQKKLFNDLQIVVDNIDVANSLITEKEKQMAKELMIRLLEMEKRLSKLPDVLMNSNEEFLYSYTMVIIEDLGNTKRRFSSLMNNSEVPPFKSRRTVIIKRFNNQEKRFQSQQEPDNQFQSNNSINNSNNLDRIEEESDNEYHPEISHGDYDPFNKLNNVYHTPPDKEEFKPLKQTVNFKPDINFDLLDMDNGNEIKEKDLKQVGVNNIKFGPSKNQEFDLNLMEFNINPINHPVNPQMQIFSGYNNNRNFGENQMFQQNNFNHNPSQYKPQNIITFEKVEKNQIRTDKIEYDPFSFFNENELLNENKRN